MKPLSYLYHKLIDERGMPEQAIREHALAASFFQVNHEECYKKDWIKTNHRNYLYLKEAEALSLSLQKSAVTFSWLKGIYLHREIYPKGFTRSMSDLDIFLSLKEMALWGPLIEAHGFKRTQGQSSLSANKIEYHKDILGELVCLEIHTSLYYELHNQSDQVRDCPQSVEEHLAYLIYHYMRQHSGARLVWLLDILTLAQSQELDWNKLEGLLIKLKLEKAYKILLNNTKEAKILVPLFERQSLAIDLFKTRTRNWRYYILKHYVRGGVGSFRYNARWVREKIENRFLE